MSRTSSPRATRVAAALLAGGLLVAACSTDDEDATPAETAPPTTASTESTAAPTTTIDTTPPEFPVSDIVGVVLENGPTFSDLAGYVLDAGLLDALRGGPFTVFAPTNEAFAAIPLDTRRAVGNDVDLLTTILTYHVVEGTLTAADLEEGELMTLAGIPLTITREGETVLVNDIPVVAADVPASNGVIHVLGSVLLPPEG